jgi:hypothetical protein
MAWRKNRRALDEGHRDLAYLPRGPAQWDATLAAVAYAMRRTIESRPPISAHGFDTVSVRAPGTGNWASAPSCYGMERAANGRRR